METLSGLSPLLLTFIATLITWIITALGSSVVFFVRTFNPKIVAGLFSFASGVMIASSFFSLLLPAINFSDTLNMPTFAIIPTCFFMGIVILIVCDIILHKKLSAKNLYQHKKDFLLVSSITLHNIPEGMCIGVAFAGIATGVSTIGGAFMLAIGIAIQNFPEGAAVSFPLYANGKSRFKSFMFGQLSGFVEIVSGLVACLLASAITFLLPIMLSFAAGMMIVVACVELMPDATKTGKFISMLFFGGGFFLMTLLDLLLN